MRVGLVAGRVGERTISWGAGPTAAQYSTEDQPDRDPVRANAGGWNCRTHEEYEGQAAVDWYLPEGTQIRSTMDGTASLFIITTSNPFDVYGVNREPYLGNPDRSRAPVSPFPGPGGGKGVFVRVENDSFVTEYAHLSIGATAALVPPEAWEAPYGAATDFTTRFAALRNTNARTLVARWDVRRGDAVGLSGDSGYSEAPHLHYTVSRAGGPLLCPTAEGGYADGGWLLK